MKEIYLGNKPVAAVCAGNRVVWQSYMCFESGTAVVGTAVNDCKLQAAGGTSHAVNSSFLPAAETSAEVSGTEDLHSKSAGAAIAYAKPCLRHFTTIENSNIVFAASEANIRASPSAGSTAEGPGGGLCESGAIAATGEVKQETYVCGIVQNNSAITTPGAVMQEAYSCEGVHEINAISAASLSPAAACAFEAVAQAQHAFGNSEDVEATEILQLTPCEDVTAAYAALQSAETDLHGVPVTARTTAVNADLLDKRTDCAAAYTVDVAVSNGQTETRESECVFSGGYVAEISLELYKEPVQPGEFDSTTIDVIDVLSVEDIDNMTILN